MPTSGKTKNLLWIEDDYVLLKDLVFPLESSGFNVDSVISLSETLERLRSRKKYDVFLVDLLLPRGEGRDAVVRADETEAEVGFEAIREIRRAYGGAAPILVFSVLRADEDLMSRLAALGVDCLMPKGIFDPLELKDRITEVASA